MVAFHNAIKITYIPFPFPYAQTCDCLLLLHWLAVPLVTSQWVTSPVWASIFVLVQVFPLWCLNLIAVEIENPFGQDPNDINGRHMQVEMNRHLLLLLQPETIRTPELIEVAREPTVEDDEYEDVAIKCFNEVWDGIDGGPDEATKTARKQIANFANCAANVNSSTSPSDWTSAAASMGRKTAFGGARKTVSSEGQRSEDLKKSRAYNSYRMSFGDGMPKRKSFTRQSSGGPAGRDTTHSSGLGSMPVSTIASADGVQVRGPWEPVPEDGQIVSDLRGGSNEDRKGNDASIGTGSFPAKGTPPEKRKDQLGNDSLRPSGETSAVGISRNSSASGLVHGQPRPIEPDRGPLAAPPDRDDLDAVHDI